MADERLSRFRILERVRREPARGPHARPSGRFEALEKPGTTVAAESAAGSADIPLAHSPHPAGMIEGPQRVAPPSSGLELASLRPEDQPFVRCVRCEGDNSPFVDGCTHCGTPLHTSEQRTFNERLWAARKAERNEPRAAADTFSPPPQRAFAEELARETSARTRRQMEIDEGTSARLGLDVPPRVRAVGFRIAVGVFGLLLVFPGSRGVGILLLAVLALAALWSWLAR